MMDKDDLTIAKNETYTLEIFVLPFILSKIYQHTTPTIPV